MNLIEFCILTVFNGLFMASPMILAIILAACGIPKSTDNKLFYRGLQIAFVSTVFIGVMLQLYYGYVLVFA